MKFIFSACRSTKSELLDECNKLDFNVLDETIRSIAASFAYSPHAITYRSPSLKSSLRRCRYLTRRRLEGISIPPAGSEFERANRFRDNLPLSWTCRHLPSTPHLPKWDCQANMHKCIGSGWRGSVRATLHVGQHVGRSSMQKDAYAYVRPRRLKEDAL